VKAFQDWVASEGGSFPVSKKLGVTHVAVKAWLNRKGWPKVKNIIDLIKLSKGQLTFDNIIESTRPKANRK